MKSLISALLVILSLQIYGQSEEDKVMEVINQVFTAMRTNDSTLLKDAFTDQPTTYTVFVDKEGNTRFSSGDFQLFKSAVGQPKEQVWNEPIWNEKVFIDGMLASVWVDYAFYVDNNFSHCGVDAFHLVKQDGKWRIFHLVDTRRRADCEIPEEVAAKFK